MTSKFSKAFLASMLMITAFGAFMPMQSHAVIKVVGENSGIVFDEPNPIRVVGENGGIVFDEPNPITVVGEN